MSNTEPVATAVYRNASGMSMKLLRKDFATEAAAQKWMDKNVDTDKVELVEMRWYNS